MNTKSKSKGKPATVGTDLNSKILEILKVQPQTARRIQIALGLHTDKVISALAELKGAGLVLPGYHLTGAGQRQAGASELDALLAEVRKAMPVNERMPDVITAGMIIEQAEALSDGLAGGNPNLARDAALVTAALALAFMLRLERYKRENPEWSGSPAVIEQLNGRQ